MPRKPYVEPDRITVEGNNGGSYITLTKTDRDGIIRLDLGHDCVGICSQEINVWSLAAILAWAYDKGFDARQGFGAALDEACHGVIPEWAVPYAPNPKKRESDDANHA